MLPVLLLLNSPAPLATQATQELTAIANALSIFLIATNTRLTLLETLISDVTLVLPPTSQQLTRDNVCLRFPTAMATKLRQFRPLVTRATIVQTLTD